LYMFYIERIFESDGHKKRKELSWIVSIPLYICKFSLFSILTQIVPRLLLIHLLFQLFDPSYISSIPHVSSFLSTPCSCSVLSFEIFFLCVWFSFLESSLQLCFFSFWVHSECNLALSSSITLS
jgi:hypothetical protein